VTRYYLQNPKVPSQSHPLIYYDFLYLSLPMPLYDPSFTMIALQRVSSTGAGIVVLPHRLDHQVYLSLATLAKACDKGVRQISRRGTGDQGEVVDR
jgi:hypothetical protein